MIVYASKWQSLNFGGVGTPYLCRPLHMTQLGCHEWVKPHLSANHFHFILDRLLSSKCAVTVDRYCNLPFASLIRSQNRVIIDILSIGNYWIMSRNIYYSIRFCSSISMFLLCWDLSICNVPICSTCSQEERNYKAYTHLLSVRVWISFNQVL